jgi:hypothetical protein
MVSRLLIVLGLFICGSPAVAGEKTLEELLQERYHAARSAFIAVSEDFKKEKASAEDVVRWSKLVLQHTLDANPDVNVLEWHVAHLKRMKDLERDAKSRGGIHLHAARYGVADAEVAIAKLKAKEKKK